MIRKYLRIFVIERADSHFKWSAAEGCVKFSKQDPDKIHVQIIMGTQN